MTHTFLFRRAYIMLNISNLNMAVCTRGPVHAVQSTAVDRNLFRRLCNHISYIVKALELFAGFSTR